MSLTQRLGKIAILGQPHSMGRAGAIKFDWLKVMAKKTIKGKITIDRERCKGCQICIGVCPTNRIEVDKSLNKKGYSPARFKENVSEGEKGCTGCAQCATVCPEIAIEVYRAK